MELKMIYNHTSVDGGIVQHYTTCSHITRRAISRMVKTALHRGQVTFLQLKPTPGRLNFSTNSSLGCSGVCAGKQEANSGNMKSRLQVRSPKEGGRVGSLIVCQQPLWKTRTNPSKEVTHSAVLFNTPSCEQVTHTHKHV